jgi:superfamily I DNA and/or RNA helicase
MAPSFYFKKGITQAADLLHQVSYYWKNCFLKHHYRSVHPDLISFSNRYFYDNQLLAYPKFGTEKPIQLITAEGVYTERVNQKEAHAVAKLIEDKVAKKMYNFGVVAFSQTQLDAIMKQLTPKTQQLLIENESKELFFKSLENVQGDECDHLIISLGYGYNEEGRFSMQFGPLNKVNGHRRLNVLMSRARKELTFFRSVQSTDFSISENEGVELLRKLMLQLEQLQEKSHEFVFPFQLNYRQQKEELTVLAPQKYIHSALALVNFHEVLIQRGWKIDYSL